MNDWVKIPRYSDYEVSRYGLVRVCERKVNQTSRWGSLMTRTYNAKILKQKINANGYKQVSLSSQKEGKTTFNVHSLVAKAFVEREKETLVVNHIDGDKTNNHYKNLEWCTQMRNIQHSKETGLVPEAIYGIESYSCKGYIEVLDIHDRVIHTVAGLKEILELGFTKQVYNVLIGNAKTHQGYKFRWKGDIS